jgi:hypothetical protein
MVAYLWSLVKAVTRTTIHIQVTIPFFNQGNGGKAQ